MQFNDDILLNMIGQKKRGVTLVELLVATAIIGTLSGLVVVNVNRARVQSRDAKRESDLRNIQVALEFYYNKHKTYVVSGSGYNGGGQGWFAYTNGTTYTTSVAQALASAGLLSGPNIEDPKQNPGYMIYTCSSGQKYALFATKESPTSSDTAYVQTVCNGSAVATSYGKNFAVGN